MKKLPYTYTASKVKLFLPPNILIGYLKPDSRSLLDRKSFEMELKHMAFFLMTLEENQASQSCFRIFLKLISSDIPHKKGFALPSLVMLKRDWWF